MEKHIDYQEHILIQNLKDGSHKAFDAIYQMYAKRLYAYSLQYTKSVEDAEDIVQEAFINLWKNKASIRQTDTLKSFLFIMTKHLLINAYRSKLNHPEFEEYLKSIDSVSVENTQHQVEYKDFIKQFSKAIAKLPATQQRVIRLSRIKQLTNKEIAEKLCLSEQTVKNQLSVGLKALQERLVKSHIGSLLLIITFFC